MIRFHPVHRIIGGNHQLVERLAIDSKSRRPHADPDLGRSVLPDRQ
jgi:hypothetical protein